MSASVHPKYLMHISEIIQCLIQNKYLTIYDDLIRKVRSQDRKSGDGTYYERHHILPKSIAPEFSNLKRHPWNGVLLTPKEHFLAHRLLCKFTTGDARISALRAYNAVCFHTRRVTNQRPTSLQYRKAREAVSEGNSGPRGSSVPEWANAPTLEAFKSQLQSLVDGGKSDSKIAKEYGVHLAVIHSWRKKLGIEKRRSLLRDKNWLEKQYVVHGRTTADIADEIGCTGAAVAQYLKRFGIKARAGNTRFSDTHMINNSNWLKEQRVNGRTLDEIAVEAGCSPPTVRTFLIKFGIE